MHSSGALLCTYGYRKHPYGQRAMMSRDGGPDSDLGYPSSVELADGSVFTVYYQKERAGGQCALLWTRRYIDD